MIELSFDLWIWICVIILEYLGLLKFFELVQLVLNKVLKKGVN